MRSIRRLGIAIALTMVVLLVIMAVLVFIKPLGVAIPAIAVIFTVSTFIWVGASSIAKRPLLSLDGQKGWEQHIDKAELLLTQASWEKDRVLEEDVTP